MVRLRTAIVGSLALISVAAIGSTLAWMNHRLSSLEQPAIIASNTNDFSVWHGEDAGERYTHLPIHNPPQCYEFRSIYSVELPPLKAGDVIVAHTNFEITNHYSYVIVVGRYIVLGDNPDDVLNLRIGKAAGRNILPEMHHDDKGQSASYVVPEDMTGKFVNVVTYAGSMLTPDSNQRAVIEQGYGGLFVQVLRGAQVTASAIVTPKPAPVDPNCTPMPL